VGRRAGDAPRARARVMWLVALACLAPLVPGRALATAYRIATGSYTGNGAGSRPIAGLGFQPDLVIIKGDLGATSVARSATMAGNSAKPLGPADGLRTNQILSLDADGFTVGADPAVNAVSNTYYWTAFKASPQEMVVGSYVGNGIDNTHLGVGFYRPT
jgi:hypothetical protein